MAKTPKQEAISHPRHGAPYEDPANTPGPDDDEGGEEEDDAPPAPEPPKDDVSVLKGEIATLNAKIEGMLAASRQSPAPQPAPEPDDFYDKIDEKLFQTPADTLKGLEDRIVSKVAKELGSRYQKDQGERDFWNDFYSKNPDLKNDDDLVKATLQGNLATLGGMPVSQAITSLATLTRDRISRYAKNTRKRPHVEGASPPSPAPPKKDEPKVVTLSDVIRNRRAARRGQAA